MGDVFHIKRGDTSPALLYRPVRPADLAAAASARFEMRLRGGAKVIDAPAAVISHEGEPALLYVWQPQDTAAAGQFEAEFRLDYPGGGVATLPTEGFVAVTISENVA